MPRRGPEQTVQAEETVKASVGSAERNIARQVRVLREREGWTYEGTAARMTAVGCPMKGTTIYKIEKADQPRIVRANELVAFSLIFDRDLRALVRSPEAIEDEVLHERFDAWERSVGNRLETEWAESAALQALLDTAESTPRLEDRGERGAWLANVCRVPDGEMTEAEGFRQASSSSSTIFDVDGYRVHVTAERIGDAS